MLESVISGRVARQNVFHFAGAMGNPKRFLIVIEDSYLAVSRWHIWVTTVIKTLVPFSFVTPPKTPPHKKVSHKNFRSEKVRSNSHFFASTFCHLTDKQKQKTQKNTKLAAD